MPDPKKIVAIGLLTEKELRQYGSSLKEVYAILDDGKFDDMLKQLELASRRRRR